jgi:hypothetical protein
VLRIIRSYTLIITYLIDLQNKDRGILNEENLWETSRLQQRHVERPLDDYYTCCMFPARIWNPHLALIVSFGLRTFCTVLIFTIVFPGGAGANSEVYALLPADVKIASYAVGDVDDDSLEELILLYRTGGKQHLSLFHAREGRWVRWWDLPDTLSASGGLALHSFGLVDSTGDGIPEISVHFTSPKGATMVTRVLGFDGSDSEEPRFGYPVYGKQDDRPSVTFLNMGGRDARGKPLPGYSRAYCWTGTDFEKCNETAWEVPTNR